jgi:leucine dehydrogenase
MDFTSKNIADDHEELILHRCRRTGLQAAIAIHSAVAGPAVGGCRRWRYDSEQAGIDDVRRLSAGMTSKNALAEIPFGGGKSVIFADAQRLPSAAQLKVFAGWLNELRGRYVTAEDGGLPRFKVSQRIHPMYRVRGAVVLAETHSLKLLMAFSLV